jgi:hypothetical protein
MRQDHPLLRGDDIFRYGYDYKGEYVWYVPQAMRAHRSTARPGEPERFECLKLLVKDTSSMLGAAFDDADYYVKDVLIVHHLQAFHHLYVLALINSRLISYYYLTSFPTIHVQRNELSEFPIRRIAFTTPPDERAQRLNEVMRLYGDCLSQGDSDGVLAFVDHELAQTPERADVVHDLLVFLAGQMIELNKQKQTEVKGFITWLERTIGAEVDDLNNKTKVKAYHDYDFETLLAVLKQNRRKLTVNPDTRIVQDAIEREFNASFAKLPPLKAKIAATDRLIALIVYRLYGLTEEEIAIVEGHASADTETIGAEEQPAIS